MFPVICLGRLWTMLYDLPCVHFSSVQFSRSVVSNSFWPHEPQHTSPPCPSPTPRVHPNPCPLSWWCHLTISSSVIPFFFCPQSFPASESFPISHIFTSRGQCWIFSFNISPFNEHTGLISCTLMECPHASLGCCHQICWTVCMFYARGTIL